MPADHRKDVLVLFHELCRILPDKRVTCGFANRYGVKFQKDRQFHRLVSYMHQ